MNWATLHIVAGEDFPLEFEAEDDDGVPVDLTGSTFSLMFRKSPETGGAAIIELDSNRFTLELGAKGVQNRVVGVLLSAETETAYTAFLYSASSTYSSGTFDLRMVDVGGLISFPLRGRGVFYRSTTR